MQEAVGLKHGLLLEPLLQHQFHMEQPHVQYRAYAQVLHQPEPRSTVLQALLDLFNWAKSHTSELNGNFYLLSHVMGVA